MITHKWIENLVAQKRRRDIIRLRYWPALANFEKNMVPDAVDIILDQTLAFLAERNDQLRNTINQSTQHQ